MLPTGNDLTELALLVYTPGMIQSHRYGVGHGNHLPGAHVRRNTPGTAPDTTTRMPERTAMETGWPSVEEWDAMVDACDDWQSVFRLMGKYVKG